MAAKRRKTNVSLEMDDATRNPPGTCAVSGKRIYAHEGDAKAIAAHRMADKESAPAKLTTSSASSTCTLPKRERQNSSIVYTARYPSIIT